MLQSVSRAQNDAKVSVGNVTQAPSITQPKCRLAGPLDVTNGKPLAEYFKSALQAELLAAQAYDVAAPTILTLNVDQVEVTTIGASASWKIGLTISSNANSGGYSVRTERPYKTSYSAYAACQNATAAFIPAVQEAIGAAINDARFAGLFQKS